MPDPEWLDRYAMPPDEVLVGRVAKWLAAHDADADLARPCELPPIEDLRRQNFEHLEEVVADAELRLRAWCKKQGENVPAGWNAPLVEARSALEISYLADFWYLSAEELLDFAAEGLGWPDSMPRVLDLEVLGLDLSELLSRDETDADDRRRRQHERTHLQIDGHEVPVDVENLRQLAEVVVSTLTESIVTQSGRIGLRQLPGHRDTRGTSGGGSGLTVARRPGMSEQQRTAVGLVGELVARAWLERHYGDVQWVSGYRNIVAGDSRGSDSLGYDFEARVGSRKVYFEVKALVGEARDFAEFELGQTEVVAAQQHGESFRILLVCSALESDSHEIFEFPNPLGRRGTGRYTILGRGLRYCCAFERQGGE